MYCEINDRLNQLAPSEEDLGWWRWQFSPRYAECEGKMLGLSIAEIGYLLSV